MCAVPEDHSGPAFARRNQSQAGPAVAAATAAPALVGPAVVVADGGSGVGSGVTGVPAGKMVAVAQAAIVLYIHRRRPSEQQHGIVSRAGIGRADKILQQQKYREQ